MLGGFILSDLMLASRYSGERNVIQLVLALFSLLAFFFLISIMLLRKKKN